MYYGEVGCQSVYGVAHVVNSQFVDVPSGRLHVNSLTLTSAVGPVPAHSTVTSPDTESTSYCWSVNTTLHCVMSVGVEDCYHNT